MPVLPYVGGSVAIGRYPAHQDLYQLPLADLEPEPVPRAGARQLPRRSAARMDSRARSAGLRLLQPQYSRPQGGWLRNLPRPRRSHAADVPGQIAADGVVSRLSPRSVALCPAAGSDHDDGIRET